MALASKFSWMLCFTLIYVLFFVCCEAYDPVTCCVALCLPSSLFFSRFSTLSMLLWFFIFTRHFPLSVPIFICICTSLLHCIYDFVENILGNEWNIACWSVPSQAIPCLCCDLLMSNEKGWYKDLEVCHVKKMNQQMTSSEKMTMICTAFPKDPYFPSEWLHPFATYFHGRKGVNTLVQVTNNNMIYDDKGTPDERGGLED